ncbi:MAG: Nudix family hydrolase [Methylovulum sp.]|nr:Nudix family hydrolase [Methylovulum sp.]
MPREHLQVAVGVVKNAAGQILLTRRDRLAPQGGLWEFPGGKLEAGESAEAALRRELNEEVGIVVQSATPLITINHQYPERAVCLQVFEVSDFAGQAYAREGQPLQWVEAADLSAYQFPAANRPIIAAAQLPPHYAILETDDAAQVPQVLQTLIAKGAKLVQVRLKQLPQTVVKDFLDEVHLSGLAQDVCLLVNSSLALVGHPAIQGLHLTSPDLLALTQRPKQIRWVAASCHTLEELHHAQAIGVDFAVLAPVLPTLTHPNAPALGWEVFADWVAQVNLPVYALGGMSLDLCQQARLAGGQGIAAIRAFLG